MNNEYQEQQPSLKHLLAMYTNSDIWSVLQTTAVDSLQMKRFCTEMTNLMSHIQYVYAAVTI